MTSQSTGTVAGATLDYVLCSLNLGSGSDISVARQLLDRQPIVLSADPKAHAVLPDGQSRTIAFGHPAGLRQYTGRGFIAAQSPFEITYSGQTFSGSSGSPVFVETPEEYRLVGLHRSGDLGSCKGKGLRVDVLVEDLLDNAIEEANCTDQYVDEVDALDDIEIEFAGAKRVEHLTSIELAESVRPLLPKGGKAYELYLKNMEDNDEIDGKEVVRSVKNNELNEIMDDLGVTKKRHSRRLSDAFLQLIMSDEDYRPLYDFLKVNMLEDLFMRFLQAGLYKDLDLLLIYRSGRERFSSFLTEPPMHLNDVEQVKVCGAALALANSGKYPDTHLCGNGAKAARERRPDVSTSSK